MVARLVARARSFWRGIRGRDDIESEMHDEFRHHLDLRADDLVRAGVPRADAERQARLEFGSTEHYKDAARESRGLGYVDRFRFSWLDFKLGFRMLARYPGLTIVGGIAIAFAIWVGAGTFEFLRQVIDPRLPLQEGDRIVALRNWDVAENRAEPRSLHDYITWRERLQTVQELGAYRSVERNLILSEDEGVTVDVAEISASAFSMTRVTALLGRTLVEADERPEAAPVALIGHELWRSRFEGDSTIVGRTIRLGATTGTVVGVMPKGFAFPVSHELWTPLRVNVLDHARRQGPPIQIFGRLAPGVTITEAESELATVGRSTAADFPETHEHLRPQILPYAKSFLNVPGWYSVALMSSNLLLVMLLVLICSNVALLMFARAATREGEIVVRSALGASRRRIITQLFSEALVLGAVGATIGLAAAGYGLGWAMGMLEEEFLGAGKLPFWFRGTLSPATILYAAMLTVLGAVIAGVLPALKVTRGTATRLKETTAGGGGLRFGGMWTAIIVMQVAVTVAFPAVAFFVRDDATKIRTLDVGFPAQEYLSVRLEMERDPPVAMADTSRAAFLARYGENQLKLVRRLEADPAVTGVTLADRLPRMYHQWNQIEVDAGAVAPRDARGHRVSSAKVAGNYFDILGIPVLSGRGFASADLLPDARTVIVNQPFVDMVLGGLNPIGRRVRYIANESDRPASAEGPWYEIVGLVRDIGMTSGYGRAGIYHAASNGAAYPMHLAIHVRGNPEDFARRLRSTATAVDPGLRLNLLMPLEDVVNAEMKFYAFWFWISLLVSSVALLLSLAGIYAVMSFTVSRRTREIGIRVAIGANPRSIAIAIFRRPLLQVGIGVIAGAVAVFAVSSLRSANVSAVQAFAVAAYAIVMMAVCMLACIVPTRRALRVEPTEALRSEV